MAIFSVSEVSFIRSLPEAKRIFLTGTLFLYVFRGNNQAQIRELLVERDIPFDFLSWRRKLHTNGQLLRDGKIWLYGTYCKESLLSKQFDLTKADKVFIDYALRYNPLRSRLFDLRKNEDRHSMSLSEFDKFTVDVLTSSDLLSYTRRYIHKKMGFLLRSYNVEVAEIESDLLSWAHYGLLRSYPRFDDVGHGLAIAKTMVKRRGVNFMKTMTKKGSNQLVQNASGAYEKTTVSMSNIADGTGQFLTADGTFMHRSLLVVGIDGVNSSRNVVGWETQQAIRQLQESQTLNGLHKNFLNLMLGEHSEEFSEFLGADNEDVIEKADYSTYTQKVCEFIGITHQKALSFLESLKPHLGGTSQSQL